jgi:diguanylate cyclase (GGDEF)-like protein
LHAARLIPEASGLATEDVTLDNCADEPIHLPGHIQPHGALLIFDEAGLLRSWSANAAAMLGLALSTRESVATLGLPVEVLQLIDACRRDLPQGDAVMSAVSADMGGCRFDCIVHAYHGCILLECELLAEPVAHVVPLALAIDRLKRQKNVIALLQIAVAEVRALTGFDRVMAYRFRADDSGEVVAEDCLATLTPYLGQRYPASDIPAQARRLYILNTLRIIADVGYVPVPLMGRNGEAPIDLSYSVLRSISPIHIEYLQNMGVHASMSVSIVIKGQLWGLITCHHGAPRHSPYATRMACDLLSQLLAATAQNLEATHHAIRAEQSATLRMAVIDTLRREEDMLQALFLHATDLCSCFQADAIVVAHFGEVLCYGDLSSELATAIVDTLPGKGDEIVERTGLAQWPATLHGLLGKWVGLLGMCFDPSNAGWILALRVEQVETVRWGGRPEKLRRAGPMGERLTPRGSFEEWRETVRGRSEPWDNIGLTGASQLLAKIYILRTAELTRRATHDTLTGLPNRTLLLERTDTVLKRSIRQKTNVALLYIDLDGFKQINDSYGHSAGDFLLEMVAQRLLGEVRSGDTVARLAGDEFVVLCSELNDISETSMLTEMVQRIGIALHKPVQFDGMPLVVSASIGIATSSGTRYAATELLHHADVAMYAVKQNGRDNWQFFDPTMHEQAQQRLRISNGLKVALERDELEVRFQPIVVADSGRIVGAELLLRWFPPEGEISPSLFIPVAEMTRLIVPIGLWVFAKACRAEASWRERWGEAAPYISVNLSARQLSEKALPESFAELLLSSGADPRRLVLEVTETALMRDVEANLQVLHRLAELGLRVAADDFGTGYSSLAQLTRLPVNVLKIDRAFINGVEKRPESRAVVRAVIGLGHSLGLQVVAEGVETAAQQLELCSYGCDFIQGYYFHRPMEEEAMMLTIENEMRQGSAGHVVPLYFLIYVSEATKPQSPQDMALLVAQSSIYNHSVAITGCLVYHDGCFMQLLEGPRDELDALFEKIARDARHRKLKLVIRAKASRRVFYDWNMVLRDLTQVPSDIDFGPWQQRSISLMDLADDARTCYAFITGYSGF